MYMKRKSLFDSKGKTLALAVAASGAVAFAAWGLTVRQSAQAQGRANDANVISAADGGGAPAMAAATDILAMVPDPLAANLEGADKAVAAWKTKVTDKPQDANAWLSLGDALMQKARDSANHQYYDLAEKTYRQSLALSPRNSDALTGMARTADGRHQFDQSVLWANKALAINPRDQSAYGLIGDAQVEQGDYNGAFKTYQKMLDIRPDLGSYSRGANLLYITGDTRKAMWLMVKAIKAGGGYGENAAWCNAKLAEMLIGEGAILPAESILKDALKVAPNDYHLLAAMGHIKTARGKYDEAIALYQKSVAIAPDHSSLVALGDLYVKTGQKERAEETFALVESLHEQHRKYGSRDELYMARFFADHDRQLPRALAVATLHKNAKNAVALDTVAWCYYKNNKWDEAKNAIDQALATTAPDTSVLFHAGMIYAHFGQRPAAQKYLYQAMSRNPYFSLRDAPLAANTLAKLGSAPPAAPPGSVALAKGKDL